MAGASRFPGRPLGSAIVRVHPTGKVQVFIGASRTDRAMKPHSRSRRERDWVDVNDVKGAGDTDVTPMRGDVRQPHHGGRRRRADSGTRKVKEKAKVMAAHIARSRVEDMDTPTASSS